MNAGIADFFGSNSSIYEEKLLKAKSMAISELKKLAAEHGADAIIGLDVDYTTFSADIMGVIANGTAVKIEKASDSSSMVLDKRYNLGRGEKTILFPIVNYYENLSFRPYNLTLDILTNTIKISIYKYKKENLSAMDVNIVVNTIFNTVYEYADINFVDIGIKDGITETEEILLNIDNNRLKVAESITLKINHYILDGKVYTMNEAYQVSNMPMEQLLEFRKSYGEDVVSDFQDDFSQWICLCGNKNAAETDKCFLCERNRKKYTRAKSRKVVSLGSLLPELTELHNCQEISSYLKNIELKHEFQFPETVMNDVKKMTEIERMYGNMKSSLICTLKKYVSENE